MDARYGVGGCSSVSSRIMFGCLFTCSCIGYLVWNTAGDLCGGVCEGSGDVIGMAGSSSMMCTGAIKLVIGICLVVDWRLLRLAWR